MWGSRFIGQINNTPRSLGNLAIGNTVAFSRKKIVDWMYLNSGVITGNFSARPIFKFKAARPPERPAFKRRFGLDFDF